MTPEWKIEDGRLLTRMDAEKEFLAWGLTPQLAASIVLSAVAEERDRCASIAEAEAARRHENFLACKAGSREWGYDPEASAMAQGHKHVTALDIAAAIRTPDTDTDDLAPPPQPEEER